MNDKILKFSRNLYIGTGVKTFGAVFYIAGNQSGCSLFCLRMLVLKKQVRLPQKRTTAVPLHLRNSRCFAPFFCSRHEHRNILFYAGFVM